MSTFVKWIHLWVDIIGWIGLVCFTILGIWTLITWIARTFGGYDRCMMPYFWE